ncbi:MAG: hypothetical protein ACPGLV_01325 [Bacteroidia bacterium]
MKRLVLLATVTLLVNALSAQIPFSNNMNTFFSQTNPAFASVQDYSAVTIGRKSFEFYNSSLVQAQLHSTLGNFYVAISNNRNSLFDYSDGRVELGYSNGYKIKNWIFAGGIDINFGHAKLFSGAARNSINFVNSDFGLLVKYRNVYLGFSATNINLSGDQLYYEYFNASLVHQINLNKNVGIHYAIMLRDGNDNRPRSYALAGIRYKRLELGLGLQYFLKSYGKNPSCYAAYSFKKCRISYNYLRENWNGYNWHQHEIGFQFAFNTKGKEVSFLPF